MTDCTMHTHVDRHFAGTISPDSERAMRAHLSACDTCRTLYARHLLLARLDPQALLSTERIARGLGLRPRPRITAMRVGLATATAVAAAFLLRLHSAGGEFSPRGNVVGFEAPSSRVFIYDVSAGKQPTLAQDALQSGAELAFAYENGAAKHRLVVFGTDEHGHVYWFHPAWTTEADDPVAIPIEAGGQRRELPVAIRQPVDGTHLEIHSVFLDEPISVRQVEALLRQHPRGPLPIAGAIETSVPFTVAP